MLATHRNRGIGGALLAHTCAAAASAGATRMVLISTRDGEGVYRRAGFEEVARFAYWYRSFQRPVGRGRRG